MSRTWWIAVAFLFGAVVVQAVGCGGSAPGGVPPGGPCVTTDDCNDGLECVGGHCVVESCVDADGDGAGVGPGCLKFDCNDADPTVPTAQGTELCNDKDDNCNASVDEGCPCLDGGGNPLPSGSTRVCGIGPCSGTQTCGAGTWGGCNGAAPAPAEICFNGIDDNCNGTEGEGCCPVGETYCPDDAVCSTNGVCA